MLGAVADTETYAEALTYQLALRALGVWLDVEGAAPGIRILETTEGFVVQQVSADSGGLETSRTITFDEVWELDADKTLRKRSRRTDGGYQNLLRAIGFELDEANAHTILLEEIEDDLLLTYVYPHEVGGFALVKQFTVIGPETRAEMVRAAHNRRNPGKLAKGFSRLMGEV